MELNVNDLLIRFIICFYNLHFSSQPLESHQSLTQALLATHQQLQMIYWDGFVSNSLLNCCPICVHQLGGVR